MLLTRGYHKCSNELVKEALELMKMALTNAQANLQKAQERMKRVVGKRRRFEAYHVGDKAVLTTTNLCNYSPHLPLKMEDVVDP